MDKGSETTQEQIERRIGERRASSDIPEFLKKTESKRVSSTLSILSTGSNSNGGREHVLSKASAAVLQDRNKQYGEPEANFQNIANLWNAYLHAQGKSAMLEPTDIAQFMILVKVARLATNPTHIDSLVDQAGYAACGGECAWIEMYGKG